ncbi:MchS3 family protein [Escherichia coli]
MYLTKKIIISMMFILPSAAFSSDPPPLQQSLEKTTYFSIGMNGFIGYQSEGEKLYTHILTLDNPEEIFKNIIKNRKSTKESKIYAACGLYYLNEENIESLFNEMINKNMCLS